MPRRASELRFAFLLLKEHPYGREMLRGLVAAGFVPLLVIEESSAVADEEREKFLQRIAGYPLAPTIQSLCAEFGVARSEVPRHDDAHCLTQLEQLQPELLVLGGTRILRGRLLELAPAGVVNVHPGLLPECRGSASPAWSVIHDIPIGCTTHLCDHGVDEGDVLRRQQLAVRRGETYEGLCHGTLVLAGSLMRETLQAYVADEWDSLRQPQGASSHPTFKNAPQQVLDQVREKLRNGSYAHYID